MNDRMTNKDFAARGLDACPAGFEILLRATGGFTVAFWDGFFSTGRILDRVGGRPALRRVVARVVPDGGGFKATTLPGTNGAIRHNWFRTEAAAEAHVSRWVRRRFAHVTPAIDK